MAVSLQKGQKISLDKEAGTALTRIKMGLGWDVASTPKSGGFLGSLFGGGGNNDSIDLDASCIMFDASKQPIDAIWMVGEA
jgi:tellurium resistance protein TerZ